MDRHPLAAGVTPRSTSKNLQESSLTAMRQGTRSNSGKAVTQVRHDEAILLHRAQYRAESRLMAARCYRCSKLRGCRSRESPQELSRLAWRVSDLPNCGSGPKKLKVGTTYHRTAFSENADLRPDRSQRILHPRAEGGLWQTRCLGEAFAPVPPVNECRVVNQAKHLHRHLTKMTASR